MLSAPPPTKPAKPASVTIWPTPEATWTAEPVGLLGRLDFLADLVELPSTGQAEIAERAAEALESTRELAFYAARFLVGHLAQPDEFVLRRRDLLVGDEALGTQALEQLGATGQRAT